VQNLQTIKSAAAGINGLLAGIGAGVSVGAFVTLTKSVIDGVDALNDLKDATGASIENISALEDVARRSGASMATVSTALVKLNQALSAAKPGSDTEAAIKAIGLSVKDLKALDPAEAFQRIAIGLNGFADDANKARLTQELFGKSLKEVAPLLKDLAEKGTLNATVTTAQAEAAEKFNKELPDAYRANGFSNQ
jgi:predicted membrane-bound mannosyltransferase